MSKNNVVKDGERKTLSVDTITHARVARLIRMMAAERDVTLNQDDIIREALDALERERGQN